MGFFDIFRTEEPVVEERASGSTAMSSLLTGYNSMTAEKVEKIPAVQSCLNIISSTIASLPIYLYKENEDGDIERIMGDDREFLLNSEPNALHSAYNMKKHLVKDFLLYGVGYLKPEWEGNKIVEVWGIDAENIQTLKYTNGYKQNVKYHYTSEGGHIEIESDELCVMLRDTRDGITGEGLLKIGADIFNIALSQIEYSTRVYSKGSLPLGILKSKERLSQTALDRLKSSWNSLYASGSKTAASTIILEEGLDYTPISLSPQDLDLSTAQKNINADICRLFNVPYSLVESSANKYGSIQHNNVHFLQYCLGNIIGAIENSLDKHFLLEEEKKKGYFFSMDTSEVLKTTEKEKYEAVKLGLDSGLISMNEARAKMNMNKMNKNFYKWSLGAVLYNDETGDIFVPNTMTTGGDNNGKHNLDNSNSNKTSDEESK